MSASSGGDGGERIKCSQSLLSVEEADQSGNAGGGEGTMKKLSSGGDGGKRRKRSRSLLLVEEADQSGNAGGGEGALKKLSCRGDCGKKGKSSRSLLSVEEADQSSNGGGEEGTLKKLSSGGDGGKRRKRSRSLLLVEEADQSGKAGGGEEGTLKKGPWTTEEDKILVDHIEKYGEGNWNAVQKDSGLARCGKSCRLRWANHLRPGLKKGSFTAEEERQIFELHSQKGSKWAQIAALLPGRTDNEIKNFWNTRCKKRKRAGLPLYPDGIPSKCSLSGSQESADTLANESSQRDETENFNFDITDLDLTGYKFCPDSLPPFSDRQISDLVGWCSDSSHNTLSMRPSKFPRAAVLSHGHLISNSSAAVPEVSDQYGKYPMLSTPCDPIHHTNFLPTGIHATSNISSSESIYGSMWSELPSLQNLQTQQCSWGAMYVSPLPSHEYVDPFVQSTPIEPCLPPLPSHEYVDPFVQSTPIEPCLPPLPSHEYVDPFVQSTPIEPCLPPIPSHEYVDPFVQSIPIEPCLPPLPSHEYVDQFVQSTPIEPCLPPLPSHEYVDPFVQSTPIEPCLPVPSSPDCSHLLDSIVYFNSDENLKGSSIDSLQAKTDSMAPNEANINTQWDGLDDQRAASISRWVHSLETTQDYDIYHGAFNDQFPAYPSFNKEDNLNQKDFALPDPVLAFGWH